MSGGVRLRSRRQTYSMLTCLAVGMTLAGLVLPWTLGERVDTTSSASGSPDPGTVTFAEETGETSMTVAPATATSVPAGAPGTAAAAHTPSAPSGSLPSAAPTGNDQRRTASGSFEMGVTATTVKVGFLLLDVGNVGKVGVGVPGVDPRQQQQAIQIMVDEVNRTGGINGRKIEPAYRAFDVLNREDHRAACLDITEDQEVFAVAAAGGYEPAPGLCVTKEHGTPLVLLCCVIDDFFAESQGRMLSLYPGATRMMRAWLNELHSAGALKGKKIGVLNDERYDPGERMAKTALIPAFERYGYRITHRSRLDQDLSTGASQIPNEVQQMRLKGVDTVLLTANTIYSSQFVQQADAQGYHPTYYTSDWAGMYTDATNQNMPASYDGTLGWTSTRSYEWRAGRPEPPAAATCRSRYEKATGKKVERASASAEYGVIIMWCDLFDVVLTGLRGAGADLTRVRYGTGIQNAGPLAMGGTANGGFRPGRFDLADEVHRQRWYGDCRCWKPVGPWRPIPN